MDETWVADACTLPTAERPLRLTEFDALFTTALRGQSRVSPETLNWDLDPSSEAVARDLTARETECCSFFTFTVTPSANSLRVEVKVPPTQTDVLDALQRRAAEVRREAGGDQ